MNIFDATESYEKWLSRFMDLIPGDLQLKHDSMAESVFEFLRATFYRWVQRWDEVCEELAKTPEVLAVGDLHIENFGTWRDADGRMIWGVNDFDEAFRLPYVFDLVRLSVSACLAVNEKHFAVSTEDAIEAVLDGYQLGLEKGGLPYVLEEHHRWLRKLALSELREPAPFWKKMKKLKPAKGKDANEAKKAIFSSFPNFDLSAKLCRRVAGLGSLGRPRIVALADWHGGMICREAKAMAPSAVLFARGIKEDREQHTQAILKRAIRVPDPFYSMKGRWLVRRLAPHCCKIEMSHLPKKRDEIALLEAMGVETANIHIGSGIGKRIERDLSGKRRRQIVNAVEDMTDLVLEDWKAWKKNYRD